MKIYCPKCEWSPQPDSRWRCVSCGHVWNTFDTSALCPKCGKQHVDTQCLSCKRFSPHDDWYYFRNKSPEELRETLSMGFVEQTELDSNKGD